MEIKNTKKRKILVEDQEYRWGDMRHREENRDQENGN